MKDSNSPAARSPHRAITFYGYAVKKDGKYLGYNRGRTTFGYKKQFYKRSDFPVIGTRRRANEEAIEQLGEVVKVKLTMEEVGDGK